MWVSQRVSPAQAPGQPPSPAPGSREPPESLSTAQPRPGRDYCGKSIESPAQLRPAPALLLLRMMHQHWGILTLVTSCHTNSFWRTQIYSPINRGDDGEGWHAVTWWPGAGWYRPRQTRPGAELQPRRDWARGKQRAEIQGSLLSGLRTLTLKSDSQNLFLLILHNIKNAG